MIQRTLKRVLHLAIILVATQAAVAKTFVIPFAGPPTSPVIEPISEFESKCLVSDQDSFYCNYLSQVLKADLVDLSIQAGNLPLSEINQTLWQSSHLQGALIKLGTLDLLRQTTYSEPTALEQLKQFFFGAEDLLLRTRLAETIRSSLSYQDPIYKVLELQTKSHPTDYYLTSGDLNQISFGPFREHMSRQRAEDIMMEFPTLQFTREPGLDKLVWIKYPQDFEKPKVLIGTGFLIEGDGSALEQSLSLKPQFKKLPSPMELQKQAETITEKMQKIAEQMQAGDMSLFEQFMELQKQYQVVNEEQNYYRKMEVDEDESQAKAWVLPNANDPNEFDEAYLMRFEPLFNKLNVVFFN
jgi:hypothetical protein